MLFISYFVSNQESEPESEPESEQIHHDSAPLSNTMHKETGPILEYFIGIENPVGEGRSTRLSRAPNIIFRLSHTLRQKVKLRTNWLSTAGGKPVVSHYIWLSTAGVSMTRVIMEEKLYVLCTFHGIMRMGILCLTRTSCHFENTFQVQGVDSYLLDCRNRR